MSKATKKRASDQYEALKQRLKRKFRDAKLENVTESEHLRKIFKPVTDPLLEQTKLQVKESKDAAAQRQRQIKELLAIEAGQQKQQIQHGEKLRNIQRALEAATGPGYAREEEEEEDSDSEVAFNAGAMRRLSSSMGALTPASLKQIEAMTPSARMRYLEEETSLLDTVQLGPLATEYLSMFATRESLTDPTFGIRYDPGTKRYKIGSSDIDFEGDDVVVGGKKYKGTDDLWQLIMLKNPRKPTEDHPSLLDYHDILRRSNAVYRDHDPVSKRLKSSAGYKYATFIKPVFGKMGQPTRQGEGYKFYKDPNDLCERLKLIRASRDAGNNSLDEEFVHIFAEMKASGLLSDDEYSLLITEFGEC